MYLQNNFEQFKSDNKGDEWKVPIRFHEVEEEMRLKNYEEAHKEFMAAKFGKNNEKRIRNRIKALKRNDSPYDLALEYQKHRHNGLSLTCDSLIAHFGKSTSRQNLNELHFQKNCNLINDKDFEYKRLPNRGKNALYVDKNSCIVDEKPRNEKEIKSIDHYIRVADKEVYISQKYMRISSGGHQGNQATELLRFAERTKNAQQYMPLIILDGEIPNWFIDEAIHANKKIIVAQTYDLLYIVNWLKQAA